MKNLILGFISVVCFLFFAVLLFYCVSVFINPYTFMNYFDKLILVFLLSLSLYIAFICLSYFRDDVMEYCIWILFIIYFVFLFDVTILNRHYESIVTASFWDFSRMFEYLVDSSNLVPFRTIIGYFEGVLSGSTTTRIFFINIFGNVLVFSPIALFVKLLFNPSHKRFLFWFFVYILGIELLQGLLRAGSFDVDDIILNVLGTYLVYVLLGFRKIEGFIYFLFKKKTPVV